MRSGGSSWLWQIGVVVVAVGLCLALYPLPLRRSDEANFIATAAKMKRELAITAASHREEDILAHGRDHKPAKMPGYMLALAAWLTVVPDPDLVRVLNLTLFGVAVLLLYRLLVARAQGAGWPAVAAMATLPMGLAYANTAMSESFVLLVGVLHFSSWYAPLRHRLLWFYLSAFAGFATKESLALLTVAIVAVHAREFVGLHVELWRQRRGAFFAHAALAVALAWLGWSLFTDRGYFPNFRTALLEAPSLGAMLGMIADKSVENLAHFGDWRRFPQHYLHGYTLVTFGMALALVVWSWRRSVLRMHLALAGFWIVTLLAVTALYRNDQFHAQRVYQVCSLLTLAAWCADVPSRFARRWLRWTLLLAPIVLQTLLAVAINRYFIFERSAEVERLIREGHDYTQFLTQNEMVKPGDCVLASLADGYRILAASPHAELIVLETRKRARIRELVTRGDPDYVVMEDLLDLEPLGYRRLAANNYPRDGQRNIRTIIWGKQE